MGNTLKQQAYAQSVATTPTSAIWVDTRDPTANDIYYPIGQFWLNQPATKLWYLASQKNTTGVLQSTWELISVSSALVTLSDTSNTTVSPSSSSATPPDNIQLVGGTGITVVATPASNLLTITNTGAGTETLTGDDNVAVSPSGGTILLTGNVVANATNAKAVFTLHSGASNQEKIDVQVAAAIAATNVANVGLAAFSNAQFGVDANGFVTLTGGSGAPVLTLTGNSGGAIAPTAGNINTLGTGSITIAGAGSTLTTQLTGLTAHNVLLGEGTATIGLVAPSATSGVPLISQGAAADPVFGTAVVAGGGTGDTSFTAFSVICGGTTSTGALQNVSGVGTANQVLTSNGAGALPTWQNSSASGAITQITNSDASVETPLAGNYNILGTGSITTVGSAHTTTVQLTGLTAHNVLLGEGTATVGLVAPSATSGIPLISQGAAADPVFGTAVVAGGGTGDTSFTAFSVICGGTTSTGALQNVSGVGTANQVLTSNGAGALPTWQNASASGAVTQFTLDAGTTPITPSSGNIVLTGAQVATGVVGANVIRTDGTAGNACTIQIQRSTVSAGSNSTLNGVCHFNSSQFSVDANGFVQAIAIGTFPWTDEAGSFNAASNNGYFCTASLTATLPPTPAQGDVVRIVADTTSVVTIAANTGQKIRVGNVISASAGTCASTKQGDSINLVYRSASAVWYSMGAVQGAWTIT